MKSSITTQIKSALAKGLTPALLVATILLLGALPSVRADGGNDNNPRIFHPHSHPHGKTYSEWSKAWWTWAGSIAAANHPVLDETGQDAGFNQSGKVFFLAGNFGGTSIRTVAVPAGKALFFPILNQIYLGFPCDDRNLPGCELDQALEEANDVAGLLSFITPSMDGATLACEIDGIPVRNLAAYRPESSILYSVTLVDDNIFGLPGGPYHPCVDTGYYLMLAPLSVGSHTIHFAGANADNSFSVDVTYHLTVKAARD